MKRYVAQWRKPLRKLRKPRFVFDTGEELKLIRRALQGDTDAIIKVFKITGDLPTDFK